MGIVSSFWKQSFFLPEPRFTEKNLTSQTGKVFIVTGANTGIGYLVASILYAANATVYVAARTESKATSAINSIKSTHPNSKGTLHFLKLDLSDLSTIKASAEDFLSKEDRLDVLWNNAGVMIPGAGSTGAQGYELQYVTNILGPYLFTKLLLPILKKTAAGNPRGTVRVCWASSLVTDLMTSNRGIIFAEDGSPTSKGEGGGPPEYAVSKVANYFLGYEFGTRFGNSDGVLHNSFNPGNLKTDLQRHSSSLGGFVHAISGLMSSILLHPAIYGAYTELYAGLSPDLTIENDQGVFIWPWGRRGSVRPDISAERKVGGNSEKLYNWCEREAGKWA